MAETVNLVFTSVNEIVGNDSIGVITLTDENAERMISIVCDKAMAVQLELRARKVFIAQFMLPEVIYSVMALTSTPRLEVRIIGISEGQYLVKLYDLNANEGCSIRASDGILFAVANNVPITISKQLMERQSMPYRPQAHGVQLPVNTLSNEMLDAALKRAVEEENYELASQLRDEKRRRTKNEE